MYILILSLRHIPLVHQWSFWGILRYCYLKGRVSWSPTPWLDFAPDKYFQNHC